MTILDDAGAASGIASGSHNTGGAEAAAWRRHLREAALDCELLALRLRRAFRLSRGFPDPQRPLRSLPGAIGIADDLSVPTLVSAYALGIYPEPARRFLLWQSPAERSLLFPDDMHPSKRFRQIIREDRFHVTFDTAFSRVFGASAEFAAREAPAIAPTPELAIAFRDLHAAGYAHSFEVWSGGGLVGGGYGVAVDRAFTLERVFSLADNSAKVGFAFLNWHLVRWGHLFTDGRSGPPRRLQHGFRRVSRGDFLRYRGMAAAGPARLGPWTVEADGHTIAAWRPDAAQLRE